MKKTILDLVASEGSPVRKLVSKVWRRFAIRGLSVNDNHAGLDRLYALPDPWGMTTQSEQSRFAQTNAIIEAHVGRIGTLLEIGSGEGHQSEYLSRLCAQLYGLDVSARAVERAMVRLPQARFGIGEVSTLPFDLPDRGKYDLVVACEVLYYLSDIGYAIGRMSQLGHACLVTFFSPKAHLVAKHLEAIPGLRRGWISHDPSTWLWAFWRPQGDSPISKIVNSYEYPVA
jgi:hypothetical protein